MIFKFVQKPFMKYLVLICAITFIYSCSGTDQKAKNSQAANTNPADSTTIQWLDPLEQDLGKAKEGQVMEISWRFKNTGDKPLIFSAVNAGCGCTVADKPEEPVAPGKEGVIKAKFDSKGQSFSQHKSVYVVANNRNKSSEGQDVLSFKVEVEKQ
jgi:hypothetical protein